MKKQISLMIGSIIFIVFSLYYFHVTWTKNPLTYDTNFLAFITNNKSTEDYQSYFDSDVPRDYAVAQYLKMRVKPSENVFIWGNTAQIYVLAEKISPVKYTVAYHIAYNKKAIDETNAVLQKVKPEFIVMLPDEKEKPFSLADYHYLMTIKDTVIYERIH